MEETNVEGKKLHGRRDPLPFTEQNNPHPHVSLPCDSWGLTGVWDWQHPQCAMFGLQICHGGRAWHHPKVLNSATISASSLCNLPGWGAVTTSPPFSELGMRLRGAAPHCTSPRCHRGFSPTFQWPSRLRLSSAIKKGITAKSDNGNLLCDLSGLCNILPGLLRAGIEEIPSSSSSSSSCSPFEEAAHSRASLAASPSPPPQTSPCPSTGEKLHERKVENFTNSNLVVKKGKSVDKEHHPCCSHEPSCVPASLDLLSLSSSYSLYKAPKQNSCLWRFLLLLENMKLQLPQSPPALAAPGELQVHPKIFTQLLLLML